jgi:uncharacterized protein Yka (UPF0111/DUF47 family)
MQIGQISARLDASLRKLDKQLEVLQRKHAQASPETREQLTNDIEHLQQMREKLIRSRDLALRVHQLERDTDYQAQERSRARQRMLGLGLCIFSLLAGIGLLAYFFYRN